jgi:hypothetical protein
LGIFVLASCVLYFVAAALKMKNVRGRSEIVFIFNESDLVRMQAADTKNAGQLQSIFEQLSSMSVECVQAKHEAISHHWQKSMNASYALNASFYPMCGICVGLAFELMFEVCNHLLPCGDPCLSSPPHRQVFKKSVITLILGEGHMTEAEKNGKSFGIVLFLALVVTGYVLLHEYWNHSGEIMRMFQCRPHGRCLLVFCSLTTMGVSVHESHGDEPTSHTEHTEEQVAKDPLDDTPNDDEDPPRPASQGSPSRWQEGGEALAMGSLTVASVTAANSPPKTGLASSPHSAGARPLEAPLPPRGSLPDQAAPTRSRLTPRGSSVSLEKRLGDARAQGGVDPSTVVML